MKKLSDEALQVLGGLKISNVSGGTLAVITTNHLRPELLADPVKGLLKRDLYVEVDKGLRALGGAWNRKLGGASLPRRRFTGGGAGHGGAHRHRGGQEEAPPVL